MPILAAAAAVFLLCLSVVLGAYWLFVVRPERKVLGRLQQKPDPVKVMKGVLKKEVDGRPSALRGFARPITEPLGRLLEQAGSGQSVETLLGRTVLMAAVGGALGGRVGGWMVAPLCAAALGAVPVFVMRYVRASRIRKFEEHFPGAIDLIARALRAGHALPVGLGMVADEMPAPVGREFRILFDEQNFGLTLPDALRNFARRIPLLDARFFVVAVLIQRESGGNLAEVLDNLSSVIRERFKVKREISTKSAHGRLTGSVLAALPPGLFLLNGLVTGGKSIAALVNSDVGVLLIQVAVALEVIGILTVRKLVDIEY